MDIKEIGEFGLIDLIKEGTIVDASNVIIGIGDDAAVYKTNEGMLELMSTDMLVEKIHFDLAYTSAFQLGYKSLAVNLSDIAAMGGVPKHVVIALAVPRRLEVEFILKLYEGMKSIAKEFGVNIIGGDTVGSNHDLIINVTVTGEVEPSHLQRRDQAKVGDLVVVTGNLGDSAGGLRCLQDKLTEERFAERLIEAHLTPTPQVEMGKIIAKYANSMNDISDGIASEAKEIAVSSHVGLKIKEACLPVSPELKTLAATLGCSFLDFALYGGEDYQLVFTIAEDKYRELQREKLPNQLTVIGVVTEKKGWVELETCGNAIVKIEAKGYNHFR